MIEVAVTSMTDQIAELRQAADTGDISGVARTAHALISSSGSVGAAGISTAARAIEARAGAGIVDPTDPDVTRLPTELAAFLEEVGRLRS
jgi:HPt (histidine-containing phosphotransfer) domain-containing protein